MINKKSLQQLDLNLLKVFQILYQEQTMARTADILSLTPSAVSHAVKRLRDALGDPLFERNKNKMVPTAACKRMAPLIIDNLTRLQQILQQWGEFSPTSSDHHFCIGMHDALEPFVVPSLARVLSRKAPNITFSSVKVERNNLVTELSAGYVDLILDVLIPTSAPIKNSKLIENEFCILLRKNHPILGELNKKTYLAATHLNVSNRPTGMTVEDTFFQQQGLARKISTRCQSFFAARELLKTSDDLLTLPKLQARHLVDKELVIREVPFTTQTFNTHIYWHANTDQDPALIWLRDTVRDLLIE